ncbi:patched domain-containing protein 3-like isoform X1 [Montipora capricornis]|uniref:patched domain-containing protein 3-like isoform X1 n=2 Tax=Montipora capricornis TaxID=246305 RepID=UPI0035F1F79F
MEVYEVKQDYIDGCGNGSLMLKKGDLIGILHKADRGWWTARNLSTKEVGWIPEAFVEKRLGMVNPVTLDQTDVSASQQELKLEDLCELTTNIQENSHTVSTGNHDESHASSDGKIESAVNTTEETLETTEKLERSCYTHPFNPCHQWSVLCGWFVFLLHCCIGKLGEKIATRPFVCLAGCILFVSFCATGILQLKVESRREKLFIPQKSRAIEDLDMAERFFTLRVRKEGIILVGREAHPNILEPDCLKEAFFVHNQIMQLQSYSDYCLTLTGDEADSLDECVTTNPFDIFVEKNFEKKSLLEIQEEITRALMNTSLIMRNGQLFAFNFEQIFGGVKRSEQDFVRGALSLQLHYFFKDPAKDHASKKMLQWEKTFLEKASSLSPSCFEVYYEAERSTDDAIEEYGIAELTLGSVTLMVMIIFSCIMLSKFANPLTGHSLLAGAGVLAVSLGILAGIGFATWCQVTFVSMVGVVPFLVISIGIDSMFILVDELDRQSRQVGVVMAIKDVMSKTGATITMTAVTDLVAFAVGTSTSFPAIRYFCTYAALAVTFSYVMMITFFVAAMSFDVRRIKAGRRDCLPLCLAPPPKAGKAPWDEPRPQTSFRVMRYWAKFLIFPASKYVILFMSVVLFAMGIYGTTKVTERFDRKMLAKDGSSLFKFLTVQEKYYEQAIPISIVLTDDVKYEDSKIQEEIRKLSSIVKENKYYRENTSSWLEALTNFSIAQNMNITGPHFIPALKLFLNVPQFSGFKQGIKLSSSGSRVIASQIVAFMKSDPTSTFQKNAMLTLRDDLATKSPLNVTPVSRMFVFFEQYAIIAQETTRNLSIAALVVLIVTSVFLADCFVTILVVANFVALVIELFGLMYIWDVTLNSVSMVILVMAIGFAVDYSAHIAHAFVMSREETADKRVVESVSTLGASVFMGGFSTFLGMFVLLFASSEIYRIFFRMFMGIVVFGLLHGLCILPVQLSLLTWTEHIFKGAGRVVPRTPRSVSANPEM